MTEITITRKNSDIVGISSNGHSGRAPHGQDIVCAGVSALMQALLVGIEDVCGRKCELVERSAFFEMKWDMETAREIRVLSETVALSLKGISESYPKNVQIMEVVL